jgi:hypothetical protein
MTDTGKQETKMMTELPEALGMTDLNMKATLTRECSVCESAEKRIPSGAFPGGKGNDYAR